PDDQEVAGEVELLDEVELLRELRLRLGRQRTEARARALPGDVAEVRDRRLARRERVVGELVTEVRQREVEPLRQRDAAAERRREIAEEPLHLGRALDVPLAAGMEATPRFVEDRVRADAGEGVEELLPFRMGVAHAVRRDDRQAQRARQVEEGAIAVLLGAQ